MATRGPQVFTIPAGTPFVDALAAGVLEECGGDPQRLSEYTILVPTRRAVRSLREAFLRTAKGKPLLLPRMTPLGDLDEDELAIAAGEELSAAGDAPPALSGLRRQLLLTKRIQGRDDMPLEQAAMLAQELGRLIDRVATEELSFAGLATLVDDEYAEHWQETLAFLRIVTQDWPEMLAKEGCIDAVDRRNRLLKAEAQRWLAHPPTNPVIAAGSTGSIPATAKLLAVIANLPNGRVVLPGFDQTLSREVAAGVRQDSQHPQHGMLALVDRFEMAPSQVKLWPGVEAVGPRGRLIAEVMRPAETTDAWRDLKAPAAEAVAGLSRIDCPGAEEEARVIALLMRQALTIPTRTAALVTPDRKLARRVAAELRRWSLEIDDSAGTPLAGTPPGAFLRLCVAAVADGFAPVSLLALAKHPLAAAAYPPATLRRLIRRLEIAVLRGPRPAAGIAGVRALIGTEAPDLARLLDRFEQAAQPLVECFRVKALPLKDLVAAHVRFAEALAGSDEQRGADRLWIGDAGEAAAAFISEIIEAAPALGQVAPGAYAGLVEALIAGRAVRPRYGTHPRLFIWGLLEARLQHADLMILSGLNEGTWPPDAEADPWMSRPMRKAFGLPPAERRIGLTAHDFAQAFCSRDVVLTRASRVEGTPTVPARWLVKLDKLLAQHGIDLRGVGAAEWLQWQALLDQPPGKPRPIAPPSPRPPVAARPRRLSVTEIETWMRDPYAIYARRVLNLREIDPLDASPDRAEYGSFIHEILDDFTARFPDKLPADAYGQLCGLGRERFETEFARPGQRAFWWPRFERIARWFVDTEERRRQGAQVLKSEAKGRLEFDGPAGAFELNGVADRIDALADGTLRIIDYKTGAAPGAREVEGGFAPQLPLEAAIAAAGGFEGVKAAAVSELMFLRLTGSDPAGEEKPASKDKDAATLALEARAGLAALIANFDRADTPYEARPRPDVAPRYSAYEHLARIKEWASGGGGEGEGG